MAGTKQGSEHKTWQYVRPYDSMAILGIDRLLPTGCTHIVQFVQLPTFRYREVLGAEECS